MVVGIVGMVKSVRRFMKVVGVGWQEEWEKIDQNSIGGQRRGVRGTPFRGPRFVQAFQWRARERSSSWARAFSTLLVNATSAASAVEESGMTPSNSSIISALTPLLPSTFLRLGKSQ